MKTKRYSFDDDVIDVLKSMEFEDVNGIVYGKITEQLDRNLYLRVNKALTVMTGTWNRSAQAHIFKDDPRPYLDTLDDGELVVDDYEFFETSHDIVTKMVRAAEIQRGDCVLEPSAGRGAIASVVDALYGDGVELDVNDVNPSFFKALQDMGFCTMFDEPRDFLSISNEELEHKYDVILQNPPFSKDVEHVYRAYDLLNNDGVLVSVMGEGPFFRSYHRDQQFREWLRHRNATIHDVPSGAFRASGTDVKARWIVIYK